MRKIKCSLISDFNIENLASLLIARVRHPQIEVDVSPYGQVVQALMTGHPDEAGFLVVWTRPQSVIASYPHGSLDEMFKEVDAYSDLLIEKSRKVKAILVPAWTDLFSGRGLGLLDLKHGVGTGNILMALNLRLARNLDAAGNIFLMDAGRWVISAGKNAFNPKLWYMAKIAFNIDVFKEAVKDIKAAVNAILGESKKLIVLDLDDTLWGGIVGDVGWENLKLGGHDFQGEAFADFQRALKSFKDRGILLAIVSKNEESVALDAIEKHPEMILKKDDFVGWRINWGDKAQNIVELVGELNLGLQSVVFIDDNPAERARVAEALPEVLVPDWPEDKMLYKKALLDLRCFDAVTIDQDDLQRTKSYLDNQKREAEKKSFPTIDEWLKSLNMRIVFEDLNNANLQRIVQLFNKTNQMNLATRRLTESELLQWLAVPNRKLWSVSISDRFGHMGLTGIISIELSDGKVFIVDFILSCRAMGRRVENVMVEKVIEYAKQAGVRHVLAKFKETEKNKPCLDFWKSSDFQHCVEENIFSLEIAG
ncbi:MAG: HAD-IIIC family phosphatase [Candidatus Margulisbacteria bacterium]|nr:HAD-IIIC family phosphatase [Candidatus Margulisiibacteriota bacterium]